MIRGLYNAATSLITRQVQQENLSNNISNLNTPGYKKTNVLLKTFDDVLINRRESYADRINTSKVIGSMNSGVGVDGIKTDYSQGIITNTDRKLDFAINDNKYMFSVVNNSGETTLTRDGRFQVSGEGFLVDSQGRKVIGSNGSPIMLTNNHPTLDENGIIDNSVGRVGFMLTEINTDNGATIRQGGDLKLVKQGYIENANIDVAEVMTDLITVSRNYESSQRVFQQMDEILGKVVNEVGVVR
ncbi:flagellar hook-basal body complex protein [Clostridium cylindrosporum]|uniref:Flagellar hook-basal body complex protein FlhO n=1 Tax=Clostridium cylindrosporum DSM 605 TaxID=1121307 RepID=A0A0J8G1U5_CLOCY|nr:flagellar hook-basal body complex protein [Clostridium cylindrosporum]KMT21721.1 flagellar hook-basal body complex protein FlhO [Clostridium cylindrosporum DSM 605]